MVETHADFPGGTFAVGTTSAQLIAADGARQMIVLTNDSDTVIWARLDAGIAVAGTNAGPAVAGQGIRLNPAGGQLVLEYGGPVSVIHNNLNATGAATTGATKNLAYATI